MANTIGGDGGAIPYLVDIEYVARYLGVTVRHVRRLVAEHRIPFIKVGSPPAVRPRRDRRVGEQVAPRVLSHRAWG